MTKLKCRPKRPPPQKKKKKIIKGFPATKVTKRPQEKNKKTFINLLNVNFNQKVAAKFIVNNCYIPLKFPLMTYGITPSGQTRSGLEVAALFLRWEPCLF